MLNNKGLVLNDQPFFYDYKWLKILLISEPFSGASVTSHMKSTGTKFQGVYLRNSGFVLICLLCLPVLLASCKGQSSLVKQSHQKAKPVLVEVMQPVPMLLLGPNDQVEPASKTSLALASDADSGSGFAIALSGDDLVSESAGK